jgi:hypothetical protein
VSTQRGPGVLRPGGFLLESEKIMHKFSAAELESQTVLELPDREVLGGLITINCVFLDVSVLEGILNGSFNNWSITALNFNSATITVRDNVSQNDLDVFCNQVVAVLSAQCHASLVDP